MTCQNIWKACQNEGLRPVCGHADYFDGRCVVVGAKSHNHGRWHLSYKPHTDRWAKDGSRKVERMSLVDAYMYRNSKWPLKHLFQGSHSTANNNDRDGDTLCTT